MISGHPFGIMLRPLKAKDWRRKQNPFTANSTELRARSAWHSAKAVWLLLEKRRYFHQFNRKNKLIESTESSVGGFHNVFALMQQGSFIQLDLHRLAHTSTTLLNISLHQCLFCIPFYHQSSCALLGHIGKANKTPREID